MYRIVATWGYHERNFNAPEPEASLGSAPDNPIHLPAAGVSRYHAMVQSGPSGIEVIDLHSKNGLLIEGHRVPRARLTPGQRVQIGVAWLEVEELSSTQAALGLALGSSSYSSLPAARQTPAVPAKVDPRTLTPSEKALSLAVHISRVGVGLPGEREDLLARVSGTLGAESLAILEKTRRGALRFLEGDPRLPRAEPTLLSSMGGIAGPPGAYDVTVVRTGRVILAGRPPWFLGVSFSNEAHAREGWRKDLLRYLAQAFFAPVRPLADFSANEAARVVRLVQGNKRRAASLLGISPGTLYSLLLRAGWPRR